MFKFNPKKLKLETEPQSTSSVQVVPYQKNSTDDKWVVKIIRVKDTSALMGVLEEVVLGFRCDHEAILPIRGYYVESDTSNGYTVYVKMLRMKATLKDMINGFIGGKSFMREEDVLQYFYTVACGLEYLHNKREIPHRNVKPSNILLTKYGIAKLADISTGKINKGGNNPETVHTIYTAPEIRVNSPGSNKREGLCQADVWSLGVVMAELCLLEPDQKEFAEMLKSEIEIKIALEMLIEKKRYKKRLLDLISSMLIVDPEQRRSAHEVRMILEEILTSQRNFSQDEESKEDLFRKRESKLVNPGDTSNQTIDTFDAIRYSLRTDVENMTDLDTLYFLKQLKESLEKGEYQGVFGFEQNKDFAVKGLNGNWVTDKGIKDFMADLGRKLKEARLANSLDNFEFNLMMCDRITDAGITSLSASIAMTFSNLKSLSLGFAGCTEITDQGIRDLGHMGATLGNLQNLVINLRWCRKITNEGLEILGSLIGTKFKNLQQLWIDFRNCSQITHEGIQSLANSIATNLKQLQDLKLNFAICTEITDAGLKAVSSCLGENTQKLTKLNLNFAGCDKITSTGVKDLTTHIKQNGTKLKELSLDFRDCNKLVDQTKLAALNTLNRVPQLNVLF